jgi:uncharacterized protein (TIGR03663 family)
MQENISNPDSSFLRPVARFFTRPKVFWWVCGVIGVLAIVTRFVDAQNKPFHHDESLHAYYSQRVANGNPHVYDGMLHGPFLYYFVGLFMWIFGSNDLIAHVPASLFGVLIVLSPLFIRKQLGNFATLVMMVLFLISPVTMYFGRFLREDVFTSIWCFGNHLCSFSIFTNAKRV